MDLTIVIVSFKSGDILHRCIKSIDKRYPILVIENSIDNKLKLELEEKYQNVNCILPKNNLGYGGGNNLGLSRVKTNYALILNPDVICNKDFFNNLSEIMNEVADYTIIGCQYLNDKIFMPAGFFDKKKDDLFRKNFKNNNIEKLCKVEWVTGCSMLINLKKFSDKEIFDKNFFLYFEEVDLCKSVIDKGENIFTSSRLKIHHLGFKSSENENLD